MRAKGALSRLIGILAATSGISILAFVALPIVSYSLESGTSFGGYLSPVPEGQVFASVDYTQPENWFEGEVPELEFSETSKVRHYNISISKLGIQNATVTIGGDDLADSLIHYRGTALPGKPGNAVIFGHSILPQFYNPKDYMAIFSTLPTMRRGDQIEVRYDGITYAYIVEEVFEVRPTDLEMLAQDKTDSFITLITCTPPGHPLRPRRLIVRARIDPYSATLSDYGQHSWN